MNKTKFGKYKVIVAGTRTFGMNLETGKMIEEDYQFLKKKLDFYLSSLPKNILEIVSGCAPGPDTMAIRYAEELGYKVWRFPPDWKAFGKKAGIVRNTLMAEFSTHLIAFWDGKSKGTKNMIEQANQHGLVVRVIPVQIEGSPQPAACEGSDGD